MPDPTKRARQIAALKAQGASPDEIRDVLAQLDSAAPPIPGFAAEATASRLGSKPTDADLGGMVASGIRGFSQAATFGLADEAASAVDALKDKIVGGPGYAARLAENRAKLHQSEQDHPGAMLAGEVGGAFAGGNIVGGGAKVLGLGGTAVAATTKAQRMARLAKELGIAGAAGGATAAGSSEGDFSDRLEAVPKGAAFGTGAVLGLKGIGKAAQATGVPALVGSVLPRTKGMMGDAAQADILKQLERARLTLPELEAKAGSAHPDEMLLDLIGEPAVERAGGAVATPSRGSADIVKALDARSQRAPKAVRGEASKALGVERENTVLAAQAQDAERKALASPLYDKAYAAPPVADPVVNAAFQLPQFQRAYTRGRRIAKMEGVELPAIGDPYWEVSVRAIDYTKRGLDDLIDSQMRSGKMGRSEARALRIKLDEVLEKTDAAVPDYKAARSAYAGSSKVIDAHELGQSFAKAKTDELAALWPMLSEAERQAYRKGAIASIEDMVRGKTEGFNPVRDFRDDIMRDNLRLIMPSEESANAFGDAVERFQAMHTNRTQIVGNSKTAARLAQQAEAAGPAQGMETAGQLIAGNPSGLMSSLARSGMAQRMRGLSEDQVNALAPLLTASGDQLSTIIRELVTVARKQAQAGATKAVATGGLAGATAASRGPRRP